MFLQKLVGAKGTKAKCEYGDYYTKKLSVLPDVIKELLFEIGLYPDEAEAYFGPMLCSIYPHFKNTEHADLLLQLMHESFPDMDHTSLNEVVRLSGSHGSRLRRDSTITQNVSVRVRVVSGHDLVAKDRGGTSDPFVKIGLVYGEDGRMVGKESQGKTNVVKKTVNPEWGEEFTFTSQGLTYRAMQLLFIRVECWDWNAITSSSSMGVAVLKVMDLSPDDEKEVVLDLKGRKGKDEKVSGQIKLRVLFSTELGRGIESDGYQMSVECKSRKSKKKGSREKDKDMQARFEEEVRQSEKETAIEEQLQQLDSEEEAREFMMRMTRSVRRNTAAVIRRSGADVPMTQPAVLRRQKERQEEREKERERQNEQAMEEGDSEGSKKKKRRVKDLGDVGVVTDGETTEGEDNEATPAPSSSSSSSSSTELPAAATSTTATTTDGEQEQEELPPPGGRNRSRAHADITNIKVDSRDVMRRAQQEDDAKQNENDYERETTRTLISRSEVMKSFLLTDPHAQYKDWHKIGQGAFGAVFCAVHNETGKKIAFKVCEEPDEKVRSITINETWQLQQCDHPNIIGYIAGYYFDQKVWLGMEYCDSGTLGDFLKMCPTPSERHLGAIMRQIVKGLKYLHGTGRLHRDIKPANILLNHDGRIKIADLGLVLSSSDAEAVAGSAYWMAPEIVNLQTYTNKVDIFSIGCVAFQMIMGQPPNSQYHPIKAKFRMGTRGIPDVTTSCSSDLKNFIERACAHNPVDRPTAAELLEHPFITKHSANRKELAALMSSILAGDNLIGL